MKIEAALNSRQLASSHQNWYTGGFLFFVLQFAIFCLHSLACGQLTGTLRFEADTFAVGAPVELLLETNHPAGAELALPNEDRDFATWVVLKRGDANRGTTTTTVRYTVTSFEVSAVQGLRLPLHALQGRDTLRALTDSVSIRLVARVPEPIPASADYRADLRLTPIALPIDWVLIVIVALTVLVASLLLFALLRRPIQRWRLSRRLQRQLAQVQGLIHQQLSTPTPQGLRAANAAWKTYIGTALQQPLPAWTTPELQHWVLRNPELPTDLRPAEVLLGLSRLEDAAWYAQRAVQTADVQPWLVPLAGVLQHAHGVQRARLLAQV
jgi:hypothetical protein